MKTSSRLRLACIALIVALALPSLALPSRAETEKRIALVIGNAAYQAGALATPANDAGVVAQTLQAAGFDVTGARDLDGESLRGAFHDFLDKAQASGPDTVAFVYLAGYGLQLDGENYFVPVDARIATATDVPVEALRISDYTKRLAALPLKASFVVLDAARESPFAKSGPPLAGGLALSDAEPNTLLAYNATPGTVSPSESGPYGVYARALVEMIREGGLQPSDLFDGVRLRVNEESQGALVPWDASRVAAPFVFFERAADAPPPAVAVDKIEALRSQPLGELGVQDAYAAAIERDTLQGYEEFLAAYSTDPLANRVRALLAARREAITWRHTCHIGTPDAYWSYLTRYPHGPHADDARWRLNALAAAEAPPPSFTPIVYDVPPPPPAEIVYVDRPVLVFSDPVYGFVPPPPVVFLAPVPAYLVFPPPPPPIGLFVLPVPAFVPVPLWVNPPAYVAAPAGNVIFTNIHNTTIINNTTNGVSSGAAGVAAGVAAGAAAGAVAARVALPPSLARKASAVGGQGTPGLRPGALAPGAAGGLPGAAEPGARLPAGHELPGTNGKPMPEFGGKLPGTPAGLPGATVPSTALPGGHALPGTGGKPLPGTAQKPGVPAAQPSTVPSTSAPMGQAQHGTANKSLPGTGQKPAKKPAASQTVPGGEGQPTVQGGNGAAQEHVKPAPRTPHGAVPSAGQPPLGRQRPPGSLPAHNGLAPTGPKGGSEAAGPSPGSMPRQRQMPPGFPQQNAPRFQGSRPPMPGIQQPHAPQAFQQPRLPRPAKQLRACGMPGLPPCR